VGTDIDPWEYADPASADRKLKAIAEDQGIRRDFQTYLQEALRELQVWLIVEAWFKLAGRSLLTCGSCNLAKGSMTVEGFLAGGGSELPPKNLNFR
jgi:hypothetical protein